MLLESLPCGCFASLLSRSLRYLVGQTHERRREESEHKKKERGVLSAGKAYKKHEEKLGGFDPIEIENISLNP